LIHIIRRVTAIVVGLVVLYLVVTFAQVWVASRRDQARSAQAIVVLGTAQYNGRPSAVLKARLDHAYDLWQRKLAEVVFVTGGRKPGDRFTEATVSADYLSERGVPQSEMLRETGGTNSWQSLASAALYLKRQHRTKVILVSDPFHSARIAAMAAELGLTPYVSPTRTSPIHGLDALGHMVKETAEVAVGRIVGFRRLIGVSTRVSGKG
jgi:uncharacterized SAM-binding protein YcdF (DUF218 family)